MRAVALSNPALLCGSVNSTNFDWSQGHAYSRPSDNSINRLVVSSGFFTTMGIPVRRRSSFTPRDDDSAQGRAPSTKRRRAAYSPNGTRLACASAAISRIGQLEIVGVLRDAKYDSVRDETPPTMYRAVPQTQGGPDVRNPDRGRADEHSGAIREAIRQVDPNLPMQDVTTQMEQFEKRFLQEKLFAQAYALFGGLALLLARSASSD